MTENMTDRHMHIKHGNSNKNEINMRNIMKRILKFKTGENHWFGFEKSE